MRTVVHPARGGSAAVAGVAGSAAAGASPLVVTYRMPTINNAPATMAAISGSLLRLPDIPVPEVWIIGVSSSPKAPLAAGENALNLGFSAIPAMGRNSNAVRIGDCAAGPDRPDSGRVVTSAATNRAGEAGPRS